MIYFIYLCLFLNLIIKMILIVFPLRMAMRKDTGEENGFLLIWLHWVVRGRNIWKVIMGWLKDWMMPLGGWWRV